MRNVVLIGFMGTGKSEVGQSLARRLGWTFIDTDRRIEARQRATVAQIFARHGEEHFRTVEASVVAEAAARRDAVIATGGGVVLRPENMMDLRRHGWIVSLTAPVDVLVKRLGEAKSRPLLRGDVRENVVRLLDQRRPLYRDADLLVDVSDATADRVVEAIVALLRARERTTISVRLADRTYPIHVGDGIMSLLPADLAELNAGTKIAVVSHRVLLRSPGAKLLAVLRGGLHQHRRAADGQRHQEERRLQTCRVHRVERQELIARVQELTVHSLKLPDEVAPEERIEVLAVALVHVPTTLLAMVDSSIGGKTGVNHAGVKNLVGAFYQPALTVADVRTLATLPERELRSGLAEVIKTAVIGDAALFEFLEQHLPAVLRRDTAALVEVISRCAAFKARVVEVDERERSERRILNYGHTIGHAVEAAAGFRRLTHGEAIAIGMALEARMAQRLGVAGAEVVERQDTLLARAGLPTKLGAVNRRAVWRAMALDKKIRDGVLRCALPVGIGEVIREQEVPDTLLREVLAGAQDSRRLRP